MHGIVFSLLWGDCSRRRPVATSTRHHFASFAHQEVETVGRQHLQMRNDKRRRHYHHWTRTTPKVQSRGYSIVWVQEDCSFLAFCFVLNGAVFPWQWRPHEVSFCACVWCSCVCVYDMQQCVFLCVCTRHMYDLHSWNTVPKLFICVHF